MEEGYDKVAPSGTVVIHARLVGEDGTVVARFSDWPQPYKLLELSNPGLTIEQNKDEVRVKVDKPAKGVWFSVQGDDEGVEFGDNSLDLFPGDEQVVIVKGMEGKVVTAAWLGSERAKLV